MVMNIQLELSSGIVCPRKMQYKTFKRIIDYLEASGKIAFDKRIIIYTGVSKPKLEALIKSSVTI